MPGIPRSSAKTSVFCGFLPVFEKGAVTLHQEIDGITQGAGGKQRGKTPRFTAGSLSLTHDNL